MQITVSRGRLFMWVQNTSNSNFYTETIQRYATAMEQIFNSLYLIYLFRQQHCISHRVDFKSARGVVGGVDGAYGYLRAPVVSRCTIISFTLHRAASRRLQKAGHWRNVSIRQPTVHIDVAYHRENARHQMWTLCNVLQIVLFTYVIASNFGVLKINVLLWKCNGAACPAPASATGFHDDESTHKGKGDLWKEGTAGLVASQASLSPGGCPQHNIQRCVNLTPKHQ